MSLIPGVVPIIPITKEWFAYNQTLTRTMIPLAPAFAISIHKSQGMTLDHIIIDIGDKE